MSIFDFIEFFSKAVNNFMGKIHATIYFVKCCGNYFINFHTKKLGDCVIHSGERKTPK